MKPIGFSKATKTLTRPTGMSAGQCGDLLVYTDGKHCVSCWRPTLKERFYILFRGRVWLGVLSGRTQPPVFVAGENVFNATRTTVNSRLRAFVVTICERAIAVAEKIINKIQDEKGSEHTDGESQEHQDGQEQQG